MSNVGFVRELATKKIIQFRQSDTCEKINRIPQINFESNNWWEVINFTHQPVSEPCVTRHLPLQTLIDSITNTERLDLPLFPSHSQSVERAVQLVSSASKSVYGNFSRHRLIQSKVISQSLRPSFDSKSKFHHDYHTIGL